MQKQSLIIYFFLFLVSGLLFGQKTPEKVSLSFGDPSYKCPGSKDVYRIIYKNVDAAPIDLVIIVADVSKEEVCFLKKNISPNDTMGAYWCNGKGTSRISIRKAGTNVKLDSCRKWYFEYKLKPTEQKKPPCNIDGKLLCCVKDKKPIVNQKVDLKDKDGNTVQSDTTDQFGDFSFLQIIPAEFQIFVANSPALPANDKLFLAKQNGVIIGELPKDANGNFTFRLLPADINKLSLVDEEDPFLAVGAFMKSKDANVVITDNIHYNAGSSELLPEAKTVLDKIVKILTENANLSVEVDAHTDARGDDVSNLKLSEERAMVAVKYILSKGIDAKRVIGRGYGEMHLINRCHNNVNCSEMEHQANRRTEFKFIKK